jgi:exonuclease III
MLGLKLSVSSQNVNSLNISTALKTNQQTKLTAILSLKSDIICLCDTRLSNKNNVNCAKNLGFTLEFNQIESYMLLFNSSLNKRGCAVLLKKSLNCLVQARRDDPEENYLLLRISLQGKTFIVGSIYGPNTNSPLFFLQP